MRSEWMRSGFFIFIFASFLVFFLQFFFVFFFIFSFFWGSSILVSSFLLSYRLSHFIFLFLPTKRKHAVFGDPTSIEWWNSFEIIHRLHLNSWHIERMIVRSSMTVSFRFVSYGSMNRESNENADRRKERTNRISLWICIICSIYMCVC